MNTRLRTLWCLGVMAVTAAAQEHAKSDRGLSTPLARFSVADKTFDEALRDLAAQSRPDVVIGFEPSIEGGSKAPPIRAALDGGTVGDALALLCAADKRFSYSEVRPGVIEVRAAQEPPVVSQLMDVPVPNVDIRVRDWPFNLFGRVQELLPSLGEYLRIKASEWSTATGRVAPGTPGITLMSSVQPPMITFHIRNTTVRGALDAIAAYTLEHGSKNRADSPYLPPVGWRVDFTADPKAPTGLGGYVKWSAFP